MCRRGGSEPDRAGRHEHGGERAGCHAGGGEIILETGHAELDEQYVSHHPGSHAGQHVVLAVSDTGCGMDESIKSKIFEPFFTTKGIGQGTGLGLSTVYGIVKQGGGTIFVYSEPGKGTTFKIYFPRVGGTAEQLEQFRDEAEFPGGSELILVVEDDEPLRDLTSSCCKMPVTESLKRAMRKPR